MYAELRLGGSGGQGLLLAGKILAEAVGVYEGHRVVQIASYGPEARGGASRSEIIISDAEIDYPEISRPQVVLAMSQEAANKYHSDLAPDGILVIDPQFVDRSLKLRPGQRLFAIPLTQLAIERTGRKVTANMVALGAIATLSGVVSPLSLERALVAHVPRGTEEINRVALAAGRDYALALTRECEEAAP